LEPADRVIKWIAGMFSGVVLCASIPQLTIDREFVYAEGEFNVIYCIDICDDGTLTNWVFGTNILGNGTNVPPEIIDEVGLHPYRAYRIHPEL
jgi:hypothetical protein